jgi:ribosomal protein S18 acetylase RimI-like enzyme
MTVRLRPQLPDDEAFLRRLIVETVAGELGAANWPEPMRSQLLDMQYNGRRQSARSHGDGTYSHIIDVDGTDSGWIVVTTMEHEVYVMEIMVLPQVRGKGIGSAALEDVISSAHAAGKPVRLTVNAVNAGAIRFYLRLGFLRIGGDEVQHLMECPLPAA